LAISSAALELRVAKYVTAPAVSNVRVGVPISADPMRVARAASYNPLIELSTAVTMASSVIVEFERALRVFFADSGGLGGLM
jgi:hypothetical protein